MSIKENYEKKLQAQLDEWRADIDKLKAKADQAEAETQLTYYKQIEKLRTMQDEAHTKLLALKEAGDSAWEDMKAGMDQAWHSLGEAVRSAQDRFSQNKP